METDAVSCEVWKNSYITSGSKGKSLAFQFPRNNVFKLQIFQFISNVVQ
jgi:hypothetical protein